MEELKKVGRYEVLGELGRGAMGVVYKAKDPVIGRTVAVKTIKLSAEGSGLSSADLLQRFQTEAQAAGLLTHPNIVVIHDAGEENGLYYITMEMVEGRSLLGLIEDRQSFPLTRTLRIMEQACAALHFAHERNVVHRDIKPANLMITSDDTVKITDFGTAKILQYGAAQQTKHVMGTPSYMSPEQIKGRVMDGRADIFSLGVMLYELVTGQRPFSGQDIATVLYKIGNEEPAPPQQIAPGVHPGISKVILKALAKDPSKRYQTCREMSEELKNYRAAGPSATATVAVALPPTTTTPPPRRRTEPVPTVPAGAPVPSKIPLKAEMPRIPGLEPKAKPATPETGGSEAGAVEQRGKSRTLGMWAAGLALAAVLGFFGVRAMRKSGQQEPVPVEPAAQVDAPAPQPARAPAPPVATADHPEVATVVEMAAPWSSKEFFLQGATATSSVPAMLVRLQGGAAEKSGSYWAFSTEVIYDRRCHYEFITDLAKLSSDYGFAAEHPMVGNPCTHTVFDPMRLKQIEGNILVRGEIVKGTDIRPPLGIDIRVKGKQIQALRLE
ncbi:MAG: serine/threonine protein kinase [Acidobacteriia bacterium]|nr:serine/threonine protein kinase [Terriglobia bacterium]